MTYLHRIPKSDLQAQGNITDNPKSINGTHALTHTERGKKGKTFIQHLLRENSSKIKDVASYQTDNHWGIPPLSNK